MSVDRHRRLDASLAPRHHPRRRVGDHCTVAWRSDTQTAAIVLAVDFPMRVCHDLAAHEQHAEHYHHGARRQSKSTVDVAGCAHAAVLLGRLNTL